MHTNVPFDTPGTKTRQCLGRPASSRGQGRGLARATARAVGCRQLRALSSFPQISTQWCDPARPNAGKGKVGKEASFQPGLKEGRGWRPPGSARAPQLYQPSSARLHGVAHISGRLGSQAMPAPGGVVFFVLLPAAASRLLWELSSQALGDGPWRSSKHSLGVPPHPPTVCQKESVR